MKKFLIILMFLWMLVATSATKALPTEPVDFPFGTTQLVACTTGIKDLSYLPVGVWVNLNQDWIVQDVDLEWTASDGSRGIGIVPTIQDIPDIPMYPAVFTLNQNIKPTTYHAKGTITACDQETCQPYPVSLSMTMLSTFALHTPDCASILFALSHAPAPPYTPIRPNNPFQLCLLFLLYLIISPLLMVWGCHWQKNERLFKRFCRYIQLTLVLLMIIGIIAAFWPHPWISVPCRKLWTILIMLAAFSWARSSPFITLLTLILMPKPGFDILQNYSTIARILFVCLWAGAWIALFQVQYAKSATIYRFLKKWHKQAPTGIRLSFSLIWLLLLAYVIIYL